MKRVLTFFVFLVLVSNSCTGKANIEIEKENIQSVLEEFIRAWETKNMEKISKIWAHDDDMINFGTDAAERWVGWESLKEKYRQMFESFEKIDFTISNQSIKVSESGTVAWYSENMDGDFVVKGEQVGVKGLRITGVLEKRNGNWVIVQRHVSLPEAGQAVEY